MATAQAPLKDDESTGPKAFGAVFVLVAIVAGVYAMVQPMTQRLDYQERAMTELRAQRTQANQRERDEMTKLSMIAERFKAVETQFEAQKALNIKIEERACSRLQKIEHRLLSQEPCKLSTAVAMASLIERVKCAERYIYKETY